MVAEEGLHQKGNYTLIADNIINATGLNIEGSNCRITNNTISSNLWSGAVNGPNIGVEGNYNQIDNNYGGSVGVTAASFNFVKDNTCLGLGVSESQQ